MAVERGTCKLSSHEAEFQSNISSGITYVESDTVAIQGYIEAAEILIREPHLVHRKIARIEP